jgi:hypothetical protein
MQGHETAKYWHHNPPAHTDQNTEPKAFELSTKGKLWLDNPKGPKCPAKWYLNGNPRVPPVVVKTQNTQQSKLLTTILTSILDKMKLNITSHSDYLSIFITLPHQQTMLLEEGGGVVGMEDVGVRMDVAADAGEDNFLVQPY